MQSEHELRGIPEFGLFLLLLLTLVSSNTLSQSDARNVFLISCLSSLVIGLASIKLKHYLLMAFTWFLLSFFVGVHNIIVGNLLLILVPLILVCGIHDLIRRKEDFDVIFKSKSSAWGTKEAFRSIAGVFFSLILQITLIIDFAL